MSPNSPHLTALQDPPPVIRDHTPVRRWRATDAAAVITVLVMLAVTIAMYLPRTDAVGLSTFTYEHIGMFNMVDTTAQRQAHHVGLMLLALLCALGAIAITRLAAHPPGLTLAIRFAGEFLRKRSGIFIAVAASLVPFFNLRGTTFPGPEGRVVQLSIWVASVCLVLLGLAWAQRQRERNFDVAIWICTISYAFFLAIPGLLRTPFLPDPLLSWAELHYSATLAQGDRLAAGLRLGSQVNLNYGLIHSLVLAVLERHWGFLDFGEHFRLVQVSQIVFLAVAILAFYLWRPGNSFFVLFGAMLIGPWISTSHLAIYYPNQSGGRCLGFALGIVALLLCRKQPIRPTAMVLGASASLLLLYNLETGLCMSLGYGLFLLSRQGRLTLAHLGNIALRAAAGAVIVFLAVLISCRAGLGNWPPMGSLVPLGLIRKFGQGYCGLPLYFDPLAILIFVHCTYLVSSSVLKWRMRDLEFEESVKLGLAATILIWASYYVNRPHAWNLWTYQFLYLFLITDIFEPCLFRSLRKRGIDAALFHFRMAPLAFVLIPMLLSSNYSILQSTLHQGGKSTVSTATVSGISMPSDLAASLREQADFLASQNASSTLFFSHYSYSLSMLSRRFNPLPAQDSFAETITNTDFENLVGEIYKVSPRVILFEGADNPSTIDNQSATRFYAARFFDRLKIRLAQRYHQGPTTSGWQVWQLRETKSNDSTGTLAQ